MGPFVTLYGNQLGTDEITFELMFAALVMLLLVVHIKLALARQCCWDVFLGLRSMTMTREDHLSMKSMIAIDVEISSGKLNIYTCFCLSRVLLTNKYRKYEKVVITTIWILARYMLRHYIPGLRHGSRTNQCITSGALGPQPIFISWLYLQFIYPYFACVVITGPTWSSSFVYLDVQLSHCQPHC